MLRYSWLSCLDERGRRGILEGRGGGEGEEIYRRNQGGREVQGKGLLPLHTLTIFKVFGMVGWPVLPPHLLTKSTKSLGHLQ